MSRYLLAHQHSARECGAVFASWRGFESPLRHASAPSTCPKGGHEVWWTVYAASADDALSQLPPYVAQRTQAIEVGEVAIP